MERKTLTKEYEQTYQLEQYQPLKCSASQTVALEEGDDVDEIAQQLHDENVQMVSREIAARIAAHDMEDGLVELLEGEADDESGSE